MAFSSGCIPWKGIYSEAGGVIMSWRRATFLFNLPNLVLYFYLSLLKSHIFMHSCICISSLNPYRYAFYRFMPNQSVDQSFNSKWQVSSFNQFPKYCYLCLLLLFQALSFRLITCIFSVCMFIELLFQKVIGTTDYLYVRRFLFQRKQSPKKFS